MEREEDLLDFCDQLEKITGSQNLNDIINEIRSGKIIDGIVNVMTMYTILCMVPLEKQ